MFVILYILIFVGRSMNFPIGVNGFGSNFY